MKILAPIAIVILCSCAIIVTLEIVSGPRVPLRNLEQIDWEPDPYSARSQELGRQALKLVESDDPDKQEKLAKITAELKEITKYYEDLNAQKRNDKIP